MNRMRLLSALIVFVLSTFSTIVATNTGATAMTQVWAQGVPANTEGDFALFLPAVQSNRSTQTPPTPTPTTRPPTLTPTPTSTTPAPPPAARGFFVSTDWLSYNADTAVDATGVHMVFYFSDERHADDKRDVAGYYVFCPGSVLNCSDPSKWGNLVQFSQQVNEMQVLSTPDGRPRILLRRAGSRGNEYEYWSCEQSCTVAGNWAGVWLTEAAGVDLYSATHPQHSFALDGDGHPFFVYSNSWGNGDHNGIWSASCMEADCREQSAWQKHQILFGPEFKTLDSDYLTLVFDGNKPRVVTRLNLSGLPDSVVYLSCDANCDSTDSWSSVTLANPNGIMWTNWDLALDSAGHPRVALFEPANIDIHVGGKLFYGECEEACTSAGSWSIKQVASGEGTNVDLAIDQQGRAHMVYDAGQRGVLAEMWCATNCISESQWQRRILKTTEQLTAEFAPASPLSCDQGVDQRIWMDAIPKLTFDPTGKLVVAYDVVNRATCYYSAPGDPSKVFSKVERIWWAVRWDNFDQPE